MIKSQGKHYLSLEDFKKIIDQVGNNKLIMLNLHKDGEPLLHKKLPEMVGYAKEKDAAHIIHLNTNGILLNTAAGKGIIEQGIDDITVSIDAAHEETYQRLKRIKGLSKLEDNVKRILEYRDKLNGSTTIRVKIMEFEGIEQDEISVFHDRWQGIADEVQVTGAHSWSGAIENIGITDEQSEVRYPCALLWYMLAVNSNGKVSVCNVDWDYSGVVGNVYEQSIKEIWNSAALRNIRKAHLDGIWSTPPVCKDCVVWVSVGDMKEFLLGRREFI